MDQNKKKINQILSPFNQIYSSKKAIKFLFSISLLGILFSYSSLLSTFYTNLFNYYNYSDKNYVFLLCNGILVLIIKNSGLFAISPANSDHFTNIKNTESHQYTGYRGQINVNKKSQLNGYSAPAVEVDKTERMVITYTDEVVENNMELVSSNEEKEQKEKEVDDPLKFVEDEEQEVNEVCNVVVVEKEYVEIDEVEEEEVIELLSTEELNKKFDDFIKKMKDGIKFEAQQHHRHNLVIV